MIEAELKARLAHPEHVRQVLNERAAVERAIYHDTYFDDAGRGLQQTGRELRLRTKTVQGQARHILTFKEPAVDLDSGSKPEHESEISDPEAMMAALLGLGYQVSIELTKTCENYRVQLQHRSVLATIVTVPELAGTFLEVETLAEAEDVRAALRTLMDLLLALDVELSHLTDELYTEAVAAARGRLVSGAG